MLTLPLYAYPFFTFPFPFYNTLLYRCCVGDTPGSTPFYAPIDIDTQRSAPLGHVTMLCW